MRFTGLRQELPAGVKCCWNLGRRANARLVRRFLRFLAAGHVKAYQDAGNPAGEQYNQALGECPIQESVASPIGRTRIFV
jgi:hypothetical protein